MRTLVLTVLLVSAVPSAGNAKPAAYPLDAISRTMPVEEKLPCQRSGGLELVRHRGTAVRYHKSVRVYPAFVPHLERFEELVKKTAIEVYGRAPRQIVHLGTYNCRRIRKFPTWMSEHALGNAIDVAGFDFPRMARGAKLPEELPRRLRRGFKVRMERHWSGRTRVTKVHARFLRLLARRMIDDGAMFTTLLGPSYPGHKNHFHLDMAPYRVVDVFGEAE